ncbi:MAG TPA: hypothetical protein VGN86_11295 [Pyrinomonadaceae bacterium]|nr:hypothetical protein [Pyrinomonadaceae bacterium]
MDSSATDNRGIFEALIGDGRPLLLFIGLGLILCGAFALFLSATRHFLPHDVQFLGITAEQLCGLDNCRIVYFMFHDRVSFGGALIAVGALYLWLSEFPLRRHESWAWWTILVSGAAGFASFLAYLGYGYLDTWHGSATLVLLPLFTIGLGKSFSTLQQPKAINCLLRSGSKVKWKSKFGVGKALLVTVACGMIAGGLTIMTVGMTRVFVPQDLKYMALSAASIEAVSPRLLPLIAHDRAGFGGAICTVGITVLFCVWCGRPSRNLWQVLCFAGLVGFATAIGIHPVVGYNDLTHLGPAIFGALMFILGLALTYSTMHSRNKAEIEQI